MKLVLHTLLFVGAAGVGLAVGFALKGKAVVRGAEAPVVAAVPAGAKGKRPGVFHPRGQQRISDDSPLATQLERDLAQANGVTRWLYWLEALEQAGPGDFARLARLAQGNSAAMRLVAARWVERAPRHLFDALVAASKGGSHLPVDELAGLLFEQWPKRDPEAAIAALNEPGDVGWRRDWRMRVATTVFDQNVERGLRVMADWHIENFGPRMTAVRSWAAADPRHAAEFTLANGAGCVAQMTMETIGKEWAKQDPAGALAFARTAPGGLGSVLGTSVLKQWAEGHLEEAAAWLGGADERTRSRLSPAFVEAWAQKDAGEALKWCGENLTGSSLAQAVGGVLKGAAAKDVASAAGLVTAMAPSPARSEGAVAVAGKWFPRLSSGEAVAPAAITWLAGLAGDALQSVMEEVYWGWSTSDPKSMATFLSTASSEQIPARAYSVLAQQMVRQDPVEALAWANRLPAERGLEAGSGAYAEWWNSQREAATQWLNTLPASDGRREAFFQSAVRTLAYNSQATEQFASMSSAERAATHKVITGMTLPEERRARLLEALGSR